MKTFITDDFLLQNEPARVLYHEYAEQAPIFDYHCHLNPHQILENTSFSTIADAWLSDDHYKWRLMRANGVSEAYITGDSDPKEKFLKWADTISRCVGNPLYHWSNLELLRYFGITELLTPDTAEQIWEQANNRLQQEDMRVRSLIKKSNVSALCTTDDPADDLEVHQKLKQDATLNTRVLPTFRTDNALHPELPGFVSYLKTLGTVAGCEITDLNALKTALKKRGEFFKEQGCLLADQSFNAPDFSCRDAQAAERALQKALSGETMTAHEYNSYQVDLLFYLGALYHRLGFTMQLHMSVSRNLNSRLFAYGGPDMGGDAIGESISTASVIAFLDGLSAQETLPKTILYTLNPSDTTRLMTLAGCFQDDSVRGKVQVGSAWWFNDHLDGMESHMTALANTGILSAFIGMLTDSRSFLSYARHEYFRRVLCNLLGTWMAKGLAPMDFPFMGKLVQDICYHNAVSYLGLDQ